MRVPHDARTALRGIHVLLVEPDPDAREVLASALEYAGAGVVAAESADAALDRLLLIVPDVLLCEIAMPVHDGRWLLKQVRARGHDLAAVAVTTSPDGGGLLPDGFSAALKKPVDPVALADAIHRAMSMG
jgi:CheY-like chemotaxis protein